MGFQCKVDLKFLIKFLLAKCVAALVMSCPSECDLIVRQFMMDVENQKSTDSIRSFALLALGEIGQNIDLSSFQHLESVSNASCFISTSAH